VEYLDKDELIDGSAIVLPIAETDFFVPNFEIKSVELAFF